MAANFWESTQRKHWLFTKEQLASIRQKLEDEDPSLVRMYPLPEWRHLYIYFNHLINKLGKKINSRQQAIATAQLYMKRFYTKVEIRRTNPILVAVTALYLALKMEEVPQHIRQIVAEVRGLYSEYQVIETSKIGECEFFLISEMHSQLIVHQPYRSLNALKTEFDLSSDEVALAWSLINDHYMTDLPLLHAPHTIALSAIMLCLVLQPPSPASAAVGSQGAASGAGGGNGAGGAGGNGGLGGALSLNIAAATAMIQQTAVRAALQGGGGPGSGATRSPTANQAQPQQQAQAAEKTKIQVFSAWLADSSVDVEAMVDCIQELISFYECHEQYSDKTTRDQVNRFVKARGL